MNVDLLLPLDVLDDLTLREREEETLPEGGDLEESAEPLGDSAGGDGGRSYTLSIGCRRTSTQASSGR